MPQINPSFFHATTLEMAKKLVGCTLTYHSPKGVISGIINETEAYMEEDPACHAYKGKINAKNKSMFCPAGHFYIYLIYGMYYCANIVTEAEGRGCAVLLRSVIPTQGIDLMFENRYVDKKRTNHGLKGLCDGPGKLCLAYGWNRSHDALNILADHSPILIKPPKKPYAQIKITKRIGITKGRDFPYRFVMDGSIR